MGHSVAGSDSTRTYKYGDPLERLDKTSSSKELE